MDGGDARVFYTEREALGEIGGPVMTAASVG
jgi:hypothetical protein